MANPKLSSGNIDTQATFSVIKRVREIVEAHPASFIMVLWDGRSWRKDIYKEYKANREQTEKQLKERQEYYAQRKEITKGLSLLGVTQASASNMEADDLAEIFSRKWKGEKVTLICADKDWLQLVDKRVTWVDPIHFRRCDWRLFEEFTGCSSRHTFVERKCIEGDAGDNVKGINGVGSKKLDVIYDNYVDFESFLNGLKNDLQTVEATWLRTTGKKLPKILRELDTDAALATVKFNMKLVDLSTEDRPEPVNLKRVSGKLDPVGFIDFCGRNGFRSFLNQFELFLKPFKENKYVIR